MRVHPDVWKAVDEAVHKLQMNSGGKKITKDKLVTMILCNFLGIPVPEDQQSNGEGKCWALILIDEEHYPLWSQRSRERSGAYSLTPPNGCATRPSCHSRVVVIACFPERRTLRAFGADNDASPCA